MSEQETRLKVAEMKLEQHDKLHEETQASIRILTDGINKLVQAEVRREQDHETFNRLFVKIDALEKKIQAYADALQAYKDDQSDKELAKYQGIVWKALSLLALVACSILAGHFGGRLLG